MKFKRLKDHRNTSVFVLIVKQLWKPFRLSKHTHRYKGKGFRAGKQDTRNIINLILWAIS